MMEKIGESPLPMNPPIHDTAIKMGFGGVKRQVGLAGSFLPPLQGLRVVGGRHLGFRLRIHSSSPWCKSDYAKKGYSHRFSLSTGVGSKAVRRAKIEWQPPFFARLYSCRRFAAVPIRKRPAGGGGFAQ